MLRLRLLILSPLPQLTALALGLGLRRRQLDHASATTTAAATAAAAAITTACGRLGVVLGLHRERSAHDTAPSKACNAHSGAALRARQRRLARGSSLGGSGSLGRGLLRLRARLSLGGAALEACQLCGRLLLLLLRLAHVLRPCGRVDHRLQAG